MHARRKWEKPIKAILYGFVVIFIASVFFWYGGMGGKGKEPPAVMAKVGKHKVARREFLTAVESLAGKGILGPDVSLEDEVFFRQLVFDNLVREKRLLEAARREGMKASRKEVSAQIKAEAKGFVQQRLKENKLAFLRELNRAGIGLEDFEKRYAATLDRGAVAGEVALRKLEAAVTGGVKVGDLELKESFDEYEAPHVQVRIGQKGREGAQATAQQILEQLKAGVSFDQVKDKVAKDDADVSVMASPTPQRRGGGTLPKEVEKAALALQVGEVCSAPIEAKEALYVVKLAKLESKLPPDFEQRKDFYKKQLEDRLKGQAWREFEEETERTIQVEIVDKEFQGYFNRREGKIDEAIAALTAALKYEYPETRDQARINYVLGQIWETKGDLDEAIALYDQAIEAAGAAPEAELKIGELLKKQGNKEAALKRFKQAAEDAGDSYTVHTRLEQAFKELGEEELAQKERAWLEQNRQQ